MSLPVFVLARLISASNLSAKSGVLRKMKMRIPEKRNVVFFVKVMLAYLFLSAVENDTGTPLGPIFTPIFFP
jgi:hypothetical protein